MMPSLAAQPTSKPFATFADLANARDIQEMISCGERLMRDLVTDINDKVDALTYDGATSVPVASASILVQGVREVRSRLNEIEAEKAQARFVVLPPEAGGWSQYYETTSNITQACSLPITYTSGSLSGTATTAYASTLNPVLTWNYGTATSGSTYNITINGMSVDQLQTWTVAENHYYQSQVIEEARESVIRRTMKRRVSPQERRRQVFLDRLKSPEEIRARETLREYISESDYRRYLTNGFLMVQGQSGRYYQIFADQRHTRVFERGKHIKSLCIHTDRECPPSDHVMNLKLLVEFDEPAVWAGSNHSDPFTYSYGERDERRLDRSLVDLFKPETTQVAATA